MKDYADLSSLSNVELLLVVVQLGIGWNVGSKLPT